MHVTEYDLFPTRLVALEFPDVDDLNRALEDLFSSEERFQGDFDQHPDNLNLLDLADRFPPLDRVRRMLQVGVRRWLDAQHVRDVQSAEAVLFCNYARKGDFTLVHNHGADLVAIYYVRTAPYDRPAIQVPDPEGEYDYFVAEDGVLMLHDPRFNANLAGVRTRDYARVFPRPGLMVVFPGFLWHSVTPHVGDFRRLALSANVTLRWPGARQGQHWDLSARAS